MKSHKFTDYPEGVLTGYLLDLAKAAKGTKEADDPAGWQEIIDMSSRLFMTYRAYFPGNSAIDHLRKQGMSPEWIARLEKSTKALAPHRSPKPFSWKPGMIWLPIFDEASRHGNIALLEVCRGGEMYTDESVQEALTSAHNAITRVLVGRETQGILDPVGRWNANVSLLGGRIVRKEELRGNSLALATALAMLSIIRNVPVPPEVAATGSLDESPGGSRIGPVGHVREKWEAARRELPGLRLFLAPKKVRPIIRSKIVRHLDMFEDAAEAVFGKNPFEGMHYGVDPERILAEIDRLHKEGNHSKVEAMTGEYIGAFRRYRHLAKEAWDLSWLRAAAMAHQGRTTEALRVFFSAKRVGASLERNGIIRHHDYIAFLNRLINTLIPHFAFEEVERELRVCLQDAMELRDRIGEGKIHGTLGQLLMFVGRFPEAEKELKAALRMVPEREHARNYCYLGNLEARTGHYAKAKRYFEKALEANGMAPTEPERLTNERFIRAGYAGLGIRSGDWEQAVKQAEKGLDAYSQSLGQGHRPSLYPEIIFELCLHRAAVLGNKRSPKTPNIRELYEKEKEIGKGSFILLLLSRLAGLDLVEAWATDGNGSETEAVEAVRDILNVMGGHSGASRWFKEEMQVFRKFQKSPDRQRQNLVTGIHQLRERMPYL